MYKQNQSIFPGSAREDAELQYSILLLTSGRVFRHFVAENSSRLQAVSGRMRNYNRRL